MTFTIKATVSLYNINLSVSEMKRHNLYPCTK